MDIFLDENSLDEISPLDLLRDSKDKAVVITPLPNNKGEHKPELIKEIIGIDAIEMGPTKAAELHGVTQASASQYLNGKHMKEETRARILSAKYDIQDVATTKLLDTLNLIKPKEVIKTRDQIALMSGLAKVVDTFTGDKEQAQQVHLHLYCPNQKKIEDFGDVIDV